MSRHTPKQTRPVWPTPEELRRDGTYACLDFVNSEWTDWRGQGPPTDRLASRDWWSRFLSRWGMSAAALTAPTGPRLADMRKIRRIMRSAFELRRRPATRDLRWLNKHLEVAPQRWAASPGQGGLEYRVMPARQDWSALTAALILSFGQLMGSSDLTRLKRCANPDCSYVFYDESTNGSRRWCFSNVCGNLVHVRSFRARLR